MPVRSYVHHSDPIGCYLRPRVERSVPASLQALVLAPAWAALRSVARSVDATLTAGDWLSDMLRAHGCPRVHTVPFGIDHARFSPALQEPALRRELLGPLAERHDARLLLVTGRLAADKRHHLLLDAAHLLAKRQPIAILVLGDGPSARA